MTAVEQTPHHPRLRRKPTTRDYVYTPANPYRGNLTRYTDAAQNKRFADLAFLAEADVRKHLNEWRQLPFDAWSERVLDLAQHIRQQPDIKRGGWGVKTGWLWLSDLSFAIRNTTVEWSREPTAVEWAVNGWPKNCFARWSLEDPVSMLALHRRAYEHFVAGQPSLFFRDFVGSHYLTHGNTSVAMVLANAMTPSFGDRRVRAADRLDMIALCGSTADFLRRWTA